jgi:hypothetical protein
MASATERAGFDSYHPYVGRDWFKVLLTLANPLLTDEQE